MSRDQHKGTFAPLAFYEKAEDHLNKIRALARDCAVLCKVPSADIDQITVDVADRFAKEVVRDPTLIEKQNLRSFVFRVVRNLAIDNARRDKRYVPLDEVDERSHGVTPAPDEFQYEFEGRLRAETERDQKIAFLRSEIGNLPEKCREVTSLHLLDGLKPREIAAMYPGKSKETIRSQLRDGVKRVREKSASYVARPEADDDR